MIDASTLAQIGTQIEKLQNSVTTSSLSPGIRQEIQSLLSIPADSLNQHRILKGLAFGGMHARVDTILEAHQQTFEWIFKEPRGSSSMRGSGLPGNPRSKNLGKDLEGSLDASPSMALDGQILASHTEGNFALATKLQSEDGISEVLKQDCDIGLNKHSKRCNPGSFLNWLSSGTGIYHVSGKPGSGKSTLMKFLCDHPHTKAELEKWAGKQTFTVSFG
jgi:Cdc6-like AAA superfamily ATPase